MDSHALRHKKPDEAIRELLRTEFGMTDEEIRGLSPGTARVELMCRRWDREAREQARAALPEMIAQGIVTRRKATRLTDDEVVEMWRDLQLLEIPARGPAAPGRATSQRPEPALAQPTRSDVERLTAAIERLTATIAGLGASRVRVRRAKRRRP